MAETDLETGGSADPPGEQLDVIAVGAHPDDVEISCGGTLALLAKQGIRVGIIDLTDGEPTPRCPSPEVRLQEAEAARQALGVHRRVILDFPNRRLFDNFETRVALATEFRRYRPRVVIGFGDRTPMASPDHWQARQIFDAAVFYSRLTKWDDYFAGFPVHRIEQQLYFGLPFAHQRTRVPNEFIVDISSTLEQKLASVRCYETQFGERPEVIDRLAHSASLAGMAAGFAAGEPLIQVRSIGTNDPMTFLFPE